MDVLIRSQLSSLVRVGERLRCISDCRSRGSDRRTIGSDDPLLWDAAIVMSPPALYRTLFLVCFPFYLNTAIFRSFISPVFRWTSPAFFSLPLILHSSFSQPRDRTFLSLSIQLNIGTALDDNLYWLYTLTVCTWLICLVTHISTFGQGKKESRLVVVYINLWNTHLHITWKDQMLNLTI